MRLFVCLTAILFIVSCNNKEDILYKDSLILSGNTTGVFSNMGEEREFTIQLNSEPSMSASDAENLLKSSEIIFKSDNDYFDFSDNVVTGNTIKFKVFCKENQTENILKDKIRMYIENTRFNLEVSSELTQDKSVITYEYKIESDITDTFTIPAEGGLFNIPIKSKRLTYINELFLSEEPYSLNGIRYMSNCVNIGWGHSDRIYKGDFVGNYIIELNADGAYNIDYEYLWEVELIDDEKTIYFLNILHPQTPGEEYYRGTNTRFDTYVISD